VVDAVSANDREAAEGSAAVPGTEIPEQLILAALGLASPE
jgi:hypothetical protein